MPPFHPPIPIEIRTGERLQRVSLSFSQAAEAAMRWSYISRQRSRWKTVNEALAGLESRAIVQLRDLGIAIPAGGPCEIAVPYSDEESSWPARVMPWEFLLRAAARDPLALVIRILDSRCHQKTKAAVRVLAEGGERFLVESALGLPEGDGGVVHWQSDRSLLDPAMAAEAAAQLEEAALAVLHAPHSGSRAASLAVGGGARAAIGLADQLEPSAAQTFLAAFYERLRPNGWNPRSAFAEALRSTGEGGFVLWINRAAASEPLFARAPRRKTTSRVPVYFDIRPAREINYAALHNGEGLFERFQIYSLDSAKEPLTVRVELSGSGEERMIHESSVDPRPVVDLAHDIHVPLTSFFTRTLTESVVSTVRMSVRSGGRTLYSNTSRMKLLAVNEWRFTSPSSAWWLASFVLPGDSAVAQLITRARHGLRVMEDREAAGFDGYQSADAQAQAKAIWCELSFRRRLAYINPPPVFTEGSQRLRSPSAILAARHGTCIDLALLMAACLEYVDIHPVLFLYRDHAFTGFWRSEDAYRQYREVGSAPAGGLEFDEVRRLVDEGSLIPLETTLMTERAGFQSAIEAGIQGLQSASGWEALIDIRTARERSITPLPILGSGEAKA
jgi:hypothetical protein